METSVTKNLKDTQLQFLNFNIYLTNNNWCQNVQMPGTNKEKIRRKLAISKDTGCWIWLKMMQTFVESFLIAFWKKIHKISLVQTLRDDSTEFTEFESLHIKLKFYLFIPLLVIKMSQSLHKKLDSQCKNVICLQGGPYCGACRSSVWLGTTDWRPFSRQRALSFANNDWLRVANNRFNIFW